MAKSEYLMLAHTYKKSFVAGWMVSEKLDGTRCFWDGGVSRNQPSKEIPWANCCKDDRLKVKPVASGLWTRSGKVIHAPEWFLDRLPERLLLDGELYAGRGGFQMLRRTIANFDPVDADWENVRYMVFDSPSAETMFRSRDIKVRNDYYFSIKPFDIKSLGLIRFSSNTAFKTVYSYLYSHLEENASLGLLRQEELPLRQEAAVEALGTKMESLLDVGAEGVMLRHPTSVWRPERSHSLLKHKPWFTAEGQVVGYKHGEGRLTGYMGALCLDFDGKRLKISGFTDKQREYADIDSQFEAALFPGKTATAATGHPLYPIGTIIEFKYRELSDDGVPKEARFLRIRSGRAL